MFQIVTAKRAYRPVYDTDCPEGCDECRQFILIGVGVELECGTIVTYTYRSQTFKVCYPPVTKLYRSGSPSDEVINPEVHSGMSLKRFSQTFGAHFVVQVLGAMLGVDPGLNECWS